MSTQYIKKQTGAATDRTYKKKDGATPFADTVSTDFDGYHQSGDLRLKTYKAAYKVKKGPHKNKKFTVKIKYKYNDNKTGKKRGRPKTPRKTFSGGWGNNKLTTAQASELFDTLGDKTKNKWLKPVTLTETWQATPDSKPDWWRGFNGFDGYKSKIDPPVGYQMPGGDSDVFKILPYSRLSNEQNASSIQAVYLGFSQTTSIMELYPTYQDVLNAGFTAADESNGHNMNFSTRFYVGWYVNDKFIGFAQWSYLDSPYGPDWPSGWYNARDNGLGAHYLDQTDGKLYRSAGGTTVELNKTPDSGAWEFWEIPSITRVKNYVENVVLPTNVAADATTTGSFHHDFPRTEDGESYYDDISKATQIRAYNSVELSHHGEDVMDNWRNSKFTIPFTARSKKKWELQDTTLMTNAGVDLLTSQEPYPYETTFG